MKHESVLLCPCATTNVLKQSSLLIAQGTGAIQYTDC